MVTENKLTSERADKPMDKKHRNILRNVRVGLVTDMDPEDILLHMAASHVFSDKDEEEIKAKKTRQGKCQTLLSILPKRGAKAFSSFVKALEKVHPHLANLIFEAGKWFSVSKVHQSGGKQWWIFNEPKDGELLTHFVNLH